MLATDELEWFYQNTWEKITWASVDFFSELSHWLSNPFKKKRPFKKEIGC